MSKNLEKVWGGLSKQRIAALHARSLQNPEHPVSKKFLAWHGTQEGGMSIGQSKKLIVVDKAKQKEREQLALQTVGATKGKAVGGEHGGAGIAQKSGEVKVYTPAEVEALNKERGTMPVELTPDQKRILMIKTAIEKSAAKKARSFDVPTMKPQTAEVQDLIDAHRSRHYTMDEEVEQIDELNQKTLKSYIKKNVDSKAYEKSPNRDAGLEQATTRVARNQATSTLKNKVSKLRYTPMNKHKNPFEYQASRDELGNRKVSEEVELEEGKYASTIAAIAAQAYEPKVGDKVRTRKGGQIPGKVEKIENNKVFFRHPEGKLYATHSSNLMREEAEQVDEGSKRMSAAVKLQRAFKDAQQQSAASRKRGKEELEKARAEYAKKQAAKTNEEAEQIDEAGKGYSPGWMLKHPDGKKLALELRRKKELERKRQKSYGDPSAGISVKKEEVEQVDEASKENKAKKNAYIRLKGLRAMRAGKIDPARGHSPTRFGREMLKKEEAELYEEPKDAADEGEYDYEGDMAKSQLRSIIYNAQKMHDMLEDNTNLPEWVQSKITLAEDYISTAANYMQGEINEENITEAKQATVAVDPDEISRDADAARRERYTPAQLAALEKQEKERAAKAKREKITVVTTAPTPKSTPTATTKTTTPKVGGGGKLGIILKLLGLAATVAKKQKVPEVPAAVPKPAPVAAPVSGNKRNIRGVQDRIDAAKRKEAADAAAAAAKKEVPVAVPKPAPSAKPAPMPVPVPVPKPVVKPSKPTPKPSGFPLMFPPGPKFSRPGGLKFHRGGDVDYFARSFEYGEIPKGYEFNSYDPTIDSSGETISEGKAMPGLSNLVSVRKNKLAKLKASKASPVKEALDAVGKEDTDVNNDGMHNTTTDKYLTKKREAIRKAIMSKTINKNGK